MNLQKVFMRNIIGSFKQRNGTRQNTTG